jgi:hypothetical protein
VNIFVGNLSYTVGDDDLRQAFSAFGQVQSANVIMDKMTGKSRGFGFVEMPNKEAAGRVAVAVSVASSRVVSRDLPQGARLRSDTECSAAG